MIFKAGIVQQYSDPEKMYCEPANCYCAEVLGEINKFPKDDKIYYIRPENLKVVDSSSNSIIIEKCFFQGKSYKLLGKYENNIWSLYSKTPLKINSEVFFEYSDSDLIYFGDSCPNFFS